MAKQNEIEYAELMNAEHAANKPFSDQHCGRNLIRLGTILTLLPPPPARLLDLGCGTGWTSQFFARAGYEVVGADIAPEMIRLANECRDRAGLKNLSFVLSDYESLSFRDEFDAAVFYDSLHHADAEAVAIDCAYRALKPGGVCVTSEPGKGHHDTEDSQRAIAQHGVTEKDMPPEHIVGLARAAGFSGFRVFPQPDALHEALFADRRGMAADPFASIGPVVGPGRNKNLWSRLRWRLWLACSPEAAWRRTVDDLLYHARWYGLVLMQKGAPAAVAAKAA